MLQPCHPVLGTLIQQGAEDGGTLGKREHVLEVHAITGKEIDVVFSADFSLPPERFHSGNPLLKQRACPIRASQVRVATGATPVAEKAVPRGKLGCLGKKAAEHLEAPEGLRKIALFAIGVEGFLHGGVDTGFRRNQSGPPLGAPHGLDGVFEAANRDHPWIATVRVGKRLPREHKDFRHLRAFAQTGRDLGGDAPALANAAHGARRSLWPR